MEGMVTRPSPSRTLTPRLSLPSSSGVERLSRWMRSPGQRQSTHVLMRRAGFQLAEHAPHSATWPHGSIMTVATLSEQTTHTPIRATSPSTGTRVGRRHPKLRRPITKRPTPADTRSSSCSCAAMAASPDTSSSGHGARTAAGCAPSVSHSTTHDDSAAETSVHRSLALSQSSEHGSVGSWAAVTALSAVHSCSSPKYSATP
mmetsp:Transcript_19228/g.48316  ORF Transcript_19228/g.48316 Transcript_19228/m.48316 type:complete len:202 (+) Transcript_19228:464-1069(+)